MAKDKSDNKCELNNINDCRYFTARESNNNYLEIHHLIPFEFSFSFENNLDVLENYIALCPHCHRLLHFGVDRERKGLLNYLFNQRKEDLAKKGINITIEDLYNYYDITER